MMLHTVRFLCSLVAAFARVVRELRKAAAMAAVSTARSPVVLGSSLPRVPSSAAAPPAGLFGAAPLPLPPRGKDQQQLVAAAPPAAVVERAAAPEAGKQARKRPSMLVIPVADQAPGELPAGWTAAAAAPEKETVEVEGDGFWLASRAGPRHAMEDAYAVIADGTNVNGGGDSSQLAFYGVFDGHGGRAAVDVVADRLGRNVVSAVLAATATAEEEASSSSSPAAEEDAVSAAIRAAFLATDSELLTQLQGESGGACAATALVKGGDLYVAHLGDCRAVLSRGGAAAALTADHTCARDDERTRVEARGGFVTRSGSGVWRVHGSLAVSRAFGDAALKRWVVADPAVARVPLAAAGGGGCEFLVMASDGLWDKVGNQEAVDAVARSRGRPAAACTELVEMARRRGSRDDVTVMVVDLERFVGGQRC